MRRTRDISNWDIAGLRQLNSTSDMNRYHILRNRGYMARYFMVHGDYRPVLFALGTAATVAKEVIRLVAVDREHVRTAGADRQGMAGLAQADARPEVAADAAVGAAIASGALSKLADTSTFCVYSCCICEF